MKTMKYLDKMEILEYTYLPRAFSVIFHPSLVLSQSTADKSALMQNNKHDRY
jgi:hypothetical protein